VLYLQKSRDIFIKDLEWNSRPNTTDPERPPLTNSDKLIKLSGIEDLDQLSVNNFVFGNDGVYGVMNTTHKVVVPKIYQSIQVFDDLTLAFKNSHYFIYRQDNLLATDIALDNLKILNHNYLQSSDGIHSIQKIIGGEFEPILMKGYDILSVNNQGYFLIVDKSNNLYGIADYNQNIVINAQYQQLKNFENSWTLGKTEEGYFAISTNQEVHPLQDLKDYIPIKVAQNIVLYKNTNDSIALYDLVNKKTIWIKYTFKNTYNDRVYGNYLVVPNDEQMAFYNFYTDEFFICQKIEIVLHKNDIYFIVMLDNMYALLDVELNALADDMDYIEYNFNLLIQKDNKVQLFAFK
jgi:hypothetical protein